MEQTERWPAAPPGDGQGMRTGVLSLESQLTELPLYDCTITLEAHGSAALDLLRSNLQLPGIIVVDRGTVRGMISRHRLLEQISLPYGREIYLPRPLSHMLERLGQEPLVLPQSTGIRDAAYLALIRPRDELNEPIVMQAESGYRLIDVHDLLTGQAEILELASRLLEESNRRLQELSVLDPLTGCGNRRMLDQVLDRDWAFVQREDKWLSVVMCDIDHFKSYNDAYGHSTGDACLQLVAEVLRSHCRRVTDTVVRFGGEEFLLVLPATKPENAVNVVKDIQRALAARHFPVSPGLTLSFGIASARPNLGATPEQLVEDADAALYRAKAEGRNRYAVSTE
ncbi:MAG: GGDEF domain-containing protein [Candidatus Nanopelagicales bacterium]